MSQRELQQSSEFTVAAFEAVTTAIREEAQQVYDENLSGPVPSEVCIRLANSLIRVADRLDAARARSFMTGPHAPGDS